MDVCFLNRLAHILRKEGTFFSVSVIIYYHLYVQQYGKHLEAGLIGSKATNQKLDKKFFQFFLPRLGIETRTFQSP